MRKPRFSHRAGRQLNCLLGLLFPLKRLDRERFI
jgi:hypothetical protein